MTGLGSARDPILFTEDLAVAQRHIEAQRSAIAHVRETASEHRDHASSLVQVAEALEAEADAKSRALDLFERALDALLGPARADAIELEQEKQAA